MLTIITITATKRAEAINWKRPVFEESKIELETVVIAFRASRDKNDHSCLLPLFLASVLEKARTAQVAVITEMITARN